MFPLQLAKSKDPSTGKADEMIERRKVSAQARDIRFREEHIQTSLVELDGLSPTGGMVIRSASRSATSPVYYSHSAS